MPDQSTLKNKSTQFFDDKNEIFALVPLHKWLLISAGVLIFLVLPLLFVWSSLGLIHTRVYDQDALYLDAGSIDNGGQSNTLY